LFSISAFAAEPAPLEVRAAPEPGRLALAVTSATLVAAVGSSVVGGVIAVSVPSSCTAQLGTPRPMCSVAGVAMAGAAQLLISLIAIPELFRISGSDPGEIRMAWWRWARVPAAVLAVSALVLLAGGVAEQNRYATGQPAMLGGMVGAAFSGLTVDVLGLVGAARAAQGLR
jgi:hypothetical protein